MNIVFPCTLRPAVHTRSVCSLSLENPKFFPKNEYENLVFVVSVAKTGIDLVFELRRKEGAKFEKVMVPVGRGREARELLIVAVRG
jgi:hypothetical protein